MGAKGKGEGRDGEGKDLMGPSTILQKNPVVYG